MQRGDDVRDDERARRLVVAKRAKRGASVSSGVSVRMARRHSHLLP